MSTIAVTATAQPNNVPPRVKVDITDSGTPAITAVNVLRTQAGVTTPVRTLDGNPLTLTTSGSNRVGTVYDPEMQYGVPVTYSTVEYPAGASSAVTVSASRIWLVHPGIPGRSMPVTISEQGDRTRDINRGVFQPMGRARPIVFTDGARQDAQGSLTISTTTSAEIDKFNALIDDAAVLLLNIPASFSWGLKPSYLSIGAVREARVVRYGPVPHRNWSFDYYVVDRPEGGSQAQWTYGDGAALFATYAAAQAVYATYAQSAAPPS